MNYLSEIAFAIAIFGFVFFIALALYCADQSVRPGRVCDEYRASTDAATSTVVAFVLLALALAISTTLPFAPHV